MQELTLALSLGQTQTGLAGVLTASLYDTAGALIAGPVGGGFTEFGSGTYQWHYAAFPDGYEGTVVFKVTTTILFLASINTADFGISGTITAAMIAAAVAAYLAANAQSVINALTSPFALTLIRGDAWAQPVAALGPLVGRTKLWFTAKVNPNDPDSAAIIQMVENVGLITLNGAPAVAGQGSIVVTNQVTGALTLNLDQAASDTLRLASRLYYDLQYLAPSGVHTPRKGILTVDWDATRAVS